MKIPAYKYPLLDFDFRKNLLNAEFFRLNMYTKIAQVDIARPYATDYRKFIDEIAEKKNIKTYLVASTISDYLFKNAEPLMNKMWKFIPDIQDQTGCILWQNYSFFYKKFTQNELSVIIYLTIIPEGKMMHPRFGVIQYDKREPNGIRGEKIPDISKDPKQVGLSQAGYVCSTLILPFIEFAETETKIVNAKTGHRAKIGKEKYVTDIPYDIEIVDSTWFTTIVRSEGFRVKGHFRLQPVGQGRLGRKLTWIADFQKHGYTRRSHIDITAEKDVDK